MTVSSKDPRRPESKPMQQPGVGWTALHSWIFLCIVALGMCALVIENRYQYLVPPGSGMTYRVAKFSGTVERYDASQGWVSVSSQPPSDTPVPLTQPSSGDPQPLPMTVPMKPKKDIDSSAPQVKKQKLSSTTPPMTTVPGRPEAPREVTARPPAAPAVPGSPAAAQPPAPKMSVEERFKVFKEWNPQYGEEEFKLANDNLYPDWQKKISPTGTWLEFLPVYKEFTQWWIDAGQPREPGVKLWGRFLTERKSR